MSLRPSFCLRFCICLNLALWNLFSPINACFILESIQWTLDLMSCSRCTCLWKLLIWMLRNIQVHVHWYKIMREFSIVLMHPKFNTCNLVFCFPASRGLSRRGKLNGEERDLCQLPTSFLSRMHLRFLKNQWRFYHMRQPREPVWIWTSVWMFIAKRRDRRFYGSIKA